MTKCVQITLFVFIVNVVPASAAELWNSGAPSASGTLPAVGWNTSGTNPLRFAMVDDFELTAVSDLTKLTCYGHVLGNTINEPRLLGAYVRILADDGGAVGELVWGSWEESLPLTETFTGAFHNGAANRPIYRVEIELPFVHLCPGRYWVQYNLDQNDIRPDTGASNANYFAQIVTPVPPDGNGVQLNLITDQSLSLQGNAPAFAIDGIVFPGCTPAGDFTGDGECNSDDMPEFIERLMDGNYNGCADVNADCEMNGLDVQAFVTACLG